MHLEFYTADGEELGQVEWLYNEDGTMIQWCDYDYEYGQLSLIEGEYDIAGNLIKETSYFQNGNSSDDLIFEYEETFTYDEQGHMTEENYDDGHYPTTTKYEYDANGFQIKASTYYQNQLEMYSTYENDANGNCIRADYYEADGTLTGYMTYERDTNGTIISTSNYDADGNLESVTENQKNFKHISR